MSEQYEFELSLYEFLTFVHTERERELLGSGRKRPLE